MPILNWIHKGLKGLRKKYILDLSPEQEEAVKKFAIEAFNKGVEVGVKVASDSISKTLTELAKDKMGSV